MLTQKDYFKMISDKDMPTEAIDKYSKGEELSIQEKYEDALVYYDEAITINRKYIKAYLGKYYALKKLLEKENKICYIKNIIKCLNKCILYGPISATPFYMKGEFYLSRHQISSAIYYFKKALFIAPKEVLIITDIARCYSMIGNYSKAEQYYNRAISFLPEYRNSVMDLMEKKFNINKIPSQTLVWNNGYNSYYEATYFEPELRAEISDIYRNLEYYSKSLAEINKAINDSNWSEYNLKKNAIYKSINNKRNSKMFNDKITENLIAYYKSRFCVEDNRHVMLYSIIKKKNNINKDINLEMFPSLFLQYPQSIIDILKLDINIDNEIITQCYDCISQTEDFSILINYFDNIYNKYMSNKKKAILYYFLGGIASAYYLFDEELDDEQECHKLSSMEMYYYSKIAKIINIDFIQIINANILNLKNIDKNNIDYYYLGQIYLLKDDIVSAKSCFDKSKSNIYSNIMLSFLNKNTDPIQYNKLSDFKMPDKCIDISTGLLIFHKYFHIIECGEAIEYYCYFNDSEIRDLIHKPIWEVFSLSDTSKDIILEKLKWNSIEQILRLSISNNLQKQHGDESDLHIIIKKIDKYSNITEAISNLCIKNKLNEEYLFKLTQHYYLNKKIDLDNFITLNLYYLNIVWNKRNNSITKAAVYSFISLLALWNNYGSIFMNILFYILDNNSGIFKIHELSYQKYKEHIKPYIFDDWHYMNIKKLLKKHFI